MRVGPAVLTLIIVFIMNLIPFLIFSYAWYDAIQVPLMNAANSTLTGDYNTLYINFLDNLRRILGVSSVISFIGIFVAYLLDSHRQEGEQFEYR